MVGESTFNGISSFTLFEAFLSVHHNHQGLFSRILWVIFETFISLILGYSIGLIVSLFCKLGLKRHNLLSKTHVEHIEGGDLEKEKQPKHSQGSAEIGMLILFPWISYLISEALNLTGMVTIFFCGVAIGQFALKNLRTPDRVVPSYKVASRKGLRYDLWSMPVDLFYLHRDRLFWVRRGHLVIAIHKGQKVGRQFSYVLVSSSWLGVLQSSLPVMSMIFSSLECYQESKRSSSGSLVSEEQ